MIKSQVCYYHDLLPIFIIEEHVKIQLEVVKIDVKYFSQPRLTFLLNSIQINKSCKLILSKTAGTICTLHHYSLIRLTIRL